MDVANHSIKRPEDVLVEMAAGHEDLAQRLLRLADAAADFHRASILDLLSDDVPAAPHEAAPGSPIPSDLNSPQAPAGLPMGERDMGSTRECDVHVAPAIRCTEAAR